MEIASCAAYGAGPRCKLRSTTPEEQRRENQAKIRRLTLDCAGEVNQPICQDFGKPSWPVLERVLDQVRFSEAITRAARGVAPRPLARHRRGLPPPADLPLVEYHGQAGAPEGALYVNGEFIGRLEVDRL